MSGMAKNEDKAIKSVDMINSTKRHAISEFKEPVFTKKQQAFIQHYVYHDLTNTESAHRAGYAGPARAASILLNDPRYAHVQTKIRELQEAQQKKFEITFDKVARDLQMIRDAAVEDGSYGAAVSAELGRAKLAGLMVDKKEIKHGRIDQMDRAEVESRLQQLIEKNQLAPVLAERAGVVVEGELADEEEPADEELADEAMVDEEPLDLEDELEDEEFQDDDEFQEDEFGTYESES
jgi:phage terminase small subunit